LAKVQYREILSLSTTARRNINTGEKINDENSTLDRKHISLWFSGPKEYLSRTTTVVRGTTKS